LNGGTPAARAFRRSAGSGAVVLEGILVVGLLVPALLLSLAWARRGWIDVALVLSACAIARDVRWGLSDERAFERATPVLAAALGQAGARALRRQSRPWVERRAKGVLVRLHGRWPLLWSFSTATLGNRHHFETTHRCLLP
jgi:hypothetical protein